MDNVENAVLAVLLANLSKGLCSEPANSELCTQSGDTLLLRQLPHASQSDYCKRLICFGGNRCDDHHLNVRQAPPR